MTVIRGVRDFTSKKPNGFFSSSLFDNPSDIGAFGKNEHVKKVFRTLFVAMAGRVLARVLDLVTAQQIVGMITGMGV